MLRRHFQHFCFYRAGRLGVAGWAGWMPDIFCRAKRHFFYLVSKVCELARPLFVCSELNVHFMRVGGIFVDQ